MTNIISDPNVNQFSRKKAIFRPDKRRSAEGPSELSTKRQKISYSMMTPTMSQNGSNNRLPWENPQIYSLPSGGGLPKIRPEIVQSVEPNNLPIRAMDSPPKTSVTFASSDDADFKIELVESDTEDLSEEIENSATFVDDNNSLIAKELSAVRPLEMQSHSVRPMINLGEINSCSDEIRNDMSGTSAQPIFVGVIPGKTVGHSFLFKVADKYYPTIISNRNKKTLNLQCRAYGRRAKEKGCLFTASLVIMTHFDRDHPDFYTRENFRVKHKIHAQEHTCQGYGVELEARQLYRQFLRDEVRKGETSYDDIKTKAMLQVDAGLFGNDISHRRAVRRLNQVKQDSNDIISNQPAVTYHVQDRV